MKDKIESHNEKNSDFRVVGQREQLVFKFGEYDRIAYSRNWNVCMCASKVRSLDRKKRTTRVRPNEQGRQKGFGQ